MRYKKASLAARRYIEPSSGEIVVRRSEQAVARVVCFEYSGALLRSGDWLMNI